MSTPLTDAINALTTYANGITGKSDTNLPDAVRSLADGYGQGSSDLPPWVSSVETVTIGENTVTNTTGAATYFNDYKPYSAIVLKTAPNIQNQIVAMFANAGYSLRYRDGAIQTSTVTTSRDGKLVEGTQYDVYHL